MGAILHNKCTRVIVSAWYFPLAHVPCLKETPGDNLDSWAAAGEGGGHDDKSHDDRDLKVKEEEEQE